MRWKSMWVQKAHGGGGESKKQQIQRPMAVKWSRQASADPEPSWLHGYGGHSPPSVMNCKYTLDMNSRTLKIFKASTNIGF